MPVRVKVTTKAKPCGATLARKSKGLTNTKGYYLGRCSWKYVLLLVDDLSSLVLDGLHHLRVAVAGRYNTDSCSSLVQQIGRSDAYSEAL